jgi:hypothetical protein
VCFFSRLASAETINFTTVGLQFPEGSRIFSDAEKADYRLVPGMRGALRNRCCSSRGFLVAAAVLKGHTDLSHARQPPERSERKRHA